MINDVLPLIITLHCIAQSAQMLPIAADIACYVHLCGYKHELCQSDWTNQDDVLVMDSGEPKELCIR